MIRKICNHTFFLLLFIILLGGFFRFYHLGITPAGLINDEADTGYDAYSILLTGRDQWNAFLPLISMRGFGDYRPALYTYLVAGSEKLFGLNTFSVRFPSAVFGCFSIVLAYIVGKKLFSEGVGLFAALLMAISPWAVGMSRVGIESNVAITFTLFGIAAFLYAKRRPILSLVGIFAFILALYTYAAYTLFIPLAAIVVFLFWRKTIPLSKKMIVFAVVIVIIAFLPFLLNKTTANTRISQVGFFNSLDTVGLTSVLNDEVGSCWQGFPHILCKITLNKPVVYISTYEKNYLSHFSPEFLYIQGSATQFAILPMRGLEYLIESAFALFGAFTLLKTKKREGIFILILFLTAVIPDAITGIGHYSRATVMLPFLLLIEACGVMYLLSLFPNLWRHIVGVVFAVVLLFSVIGFWVTYNTYFREQYATYSQYGYQQLIGQIDTQKNNYDNVYLSRHLNDTKQYIYLLFYNAYDPTLYQRKTNIVYSQGSDGWVSVDKIGNINFVASIPTRAQIHDDKNHDLIISNPIDFPKDIQPVFVIKDLQSNTIFEGVDSRVLQTYLNTHAIEENI